MSAAMHPVWCAADGRDDYSGQMVHRSDAHEVQINMHDAVTVRLVQDVERLDQPYVVVIGTDCDEPVNLHLPFAAAEEFKDALVDLLGRADQR